VYLIKYYDVHKFKHLMIKWGRFSLKLLGACMQWDLELNLWIVYEIDAEAAA